MKTKTMKAGIWYGLTCSFQDGPRTAYELNANRCSPLNLALHIGEAKPDELATCDAESLKSALNHVSRKPPQARMRIPLTSIITHFPRLWALAHSDCHDGTVATFERDE